MFKSYYHNPDQITRKVMHELQPALRVELEKPSNTGKLQAIAIYVSLLNG